MENGFYLVHKPSGITSSDLVQKIKRIRKIKKIGHTGTLDKFAEGLMILPFGKFTCFSSYFLNSPKTYKAKAVFGKFTDSGDLDGNILQEISYEEAKKFVSNNREKILSELTNVSNWKTQIPPTISALKIRGQRQADLFRKNIPFEEKVRSIKVYNLEIFHLDETSLEFAIQVSAGTYIRKIVMDLSDLLGIPMVLGNLQRTGVGKFHLEDANSLEDFQKDTFKIWDYTEMLSIPTIVVDNFQKKNISYGKLVPNLEFQGEVLLVSDTGELLAWCSKKAISNAYSYLKVFV